MGLHATYDTARKNLASLLEQVTTNREIVIIKRHGFEDVAMITASELSGLLETVYLRRSAKNAQRLHKALQHAQKK